MDVLNKRDLMEEQAKLFARYINLNQLQEWLTAKQQELDVLSMAVVLRYRADKALFGSSKTEETSEKKG